MNYFQPTKILLLTIQVSVFVLCFITAWPNAYAANLVYIDNPSGQSYAREQVKSAANVYGLDMTVVVFAGRDSAVIETIGSPNTVAVVINAAALSTLHRDRLLASMRRHGRTIPLLIMDINDRTDPVLLKEWSGEAITRCQKSQTTQGSAWYEVASDKNVLHQLAGSQLPLMQRDVFYLSSDNNGRPEWLMEARFGEGKLPVFAHTVVEDQDVFFATTVHTGNIPVSPDPYRQQEVFASLASPLIFMRFAAGEKIWHSPAAYANFTIDDLWLREPYGHVNYEQLVQQAKRHNFHATVAFIPWNFDRSQPKVVTLFRANPDRLSICVHGNNHIHQEFGPLAAHPLDKQGKDMEQALARMEKFTQLTHIPYDAVMVFPHSVAPEATLALLKHYNFLATANSLNVPSDAVAPADAGFALRSVTLQFADFPSLRRYSAETDIPVPQLAIDAFLGNPMLFYAHESYFASGMGAFDKTADTVNRLQPETEWRSLGYIVRHLYLEKLRDDGNYDIRAYSGTIDLVNNHKKDSVFYVEKEERSSAALTVLVDGRPYPFQRSGGYLHLQLAVQNGASRRIAIKYENHLDLATVDIAKNSLKVKLIRHLSDFRDEVVSDTALGRHFIRSYVEYRRNWNRAFAVLVGLIVLALLLWLVRRRGKDR